MNSDDHTLNAPRIWALADDRAGNRSQCLGVAEALGLDFAVRDLAYNATAALPNFIIGPSFAGLTADSRVHLTPPWPDVVISAGRRTAPVARQIKKLSGGKTFLVQLMHPGNSGTDEFDLIAVPGHDVVAERPNLIRTIGAAHRVTCAGLKKAAEGWRDRFADLPRPWVALIVGGSTRRRQFTDDMARELGRKASRVAAAAGGGSLLISTSRRTGDAAETLLAEISVPRYVFKWGEEGENPYFGYLGSADAIVVTGDSVSMCSEACAAPKPVFIYAPDALTTPKHGRLHAELYEKGYARPLGESLETWTHPPLNAALDVAKEIHRRLPFGSTRV